MQLCLRFAVCFCRFFFLFFLRWSNLGCPGEGFCNSWLPTSNIYGQPDATAFAKSVGQAELCCVRAVQGHSVGLMAPNSLNLGGFLSGGSVFLLIWDFSGALLTKDHFL